MPSAAFTRLKVKEKSQKQNERSFNATYTSRMAAIKESISKDESIVALHDLESMQEDLMKLFSERFSDITSKVEELRTRIDVKPIKEIPIKMPTPAPAAQMEKSDGGGRRGSNRTHGRGKAKEETQTA